jgi:hypothetical protein
MVKNEPFSKPFELLQKLCLHVVIIHPGIHLGNRMKQDVETVVVGFLGNIGLQLIKVSTHDEETAFQNPF